MRQIKVFDTTLRDGEQSPGVVLSVEEKLVIAHQLTKLGVDVIEAGFPISGPADFESVVRISREVRGSTIAAMARAGRADIDRATEALRDATTARIHIFMATSPLHMEKKLGLSPREVLEKISSAIAYAKSQIYDIEFSAEDAGRSDPDFLVEVFSAAIAQGATVINIPDTVGYQTPEQFAGLVRYVLEHTEGGDKVDWSAHCHDDLGLAVANTLAAVGAGVTQVECTVNGIGERAGNASLEEIVMALYTRSDFYGVQTAIRTREIARTSRMVAQFTGMVVPPNKAIVGANAFAHEAGIHQDGVLKARETYEIIDAELVGREAAVLVLGKHSGRHAFKQALDTLGYQFGEEEVKSLFTRFKEIAERKGVIEGDELRALVESKVVETTPRFGLAALQFLSGSGMLPTATVRVQTPAGERTATATGDGPVDAVYKALAEAIEIAPELDLYRVESVTGSTEALGEVVVRLRLGGTMAHGRGISPDIIEASARAYLDAASKLISGQAHPQVRYQEAP